MATNWRNIVLFLVVGLGLSFASDFVVNWATREGDITGLATVTNYLQGFSRYVGATCAVALLGIVAWPTVNKFANNSFQHAWDVLSDEKRLFVYIGIMLVETIAAAICFAA
jgi:ABC-type siderophore export system fused ATPase/permease subunit